MDNNETIILRSVIIALVEVAKLAAKGQKVPSQTPPSVDKFSDSRYDEPTPSVSSVKSTDVPAAEDLMNVSSDPFKAPESTETSPPAVKSLLIDGVEFDIPSDSMLFK